MVIRPSYPDLAVVPLTDEIQSPAGLYVARRVGFSQITVPLFALSPISLRIELTIGISRKNLPMKHVD